MQVQQAPQSLPYSYQFGAFANTSSCTITPLLQSSGFTLGMQENRVDPGNNAAATALLLFVADTETSYSISGLASYSGGAGAAADGALGAELVDETAGVTLYQGGVGGYPQFPPYGGSGSLNSSGGPLVGALNPADIHLFRADVDLENGTGPDSISVNVGITFTTVPEPGCAAVMATISPLLLARQKWRNQEAISERVSCLG